MICACLETSILFWYSQNMIELLEKALERAQYLPDEEQDALASQILASIESEDAWQSRFASKLSILERMAHDAVEEDRKTI